jgi:hypothetical protein
LQQNSVVRSRPTNTLPIQEGIAMEEYDATYQIGNTTVHIVAPKNMTQEQVDQVVANMHKAGWKIIHELIGKGEEV